MDIRKLTFGVGITVTVIWAASFVADIFVRDYDPSPFLHLAMMTIVGALFGRQFMKSNGVNHSGGN